MKDLFFLVFFALSFLHGNYVFAEDALSPDIIATFESELIVHGFINNVAHDQFHLQVQTVIKGSKYATGPMNLAITNFHTGSCGFPYDIGTLNEVVLYLDWRNDAWHVYHGHQHVKVVHDETIMFVICGDGFKRSIPELKEDTKMFLSTYSYANGDFLLNTNQNSNDILNNEMILLFEKMHRNPFAFNDSLEYFPVEESEIKEDTVVYQFVEVNATHPLGDEGLKEWIKLEIKWPPFIVENEITGTIIIRFIIEKDGLTTHHEVLRGIQRDADRAALEALKRMPPWNPATQNGNPVRLQMIIPIRVKFD